MGTDKNQKEKQLVKVNYPKVVEWFGNERLQKQLTDALQGMLPVEKLVRVSLTVIRNNPALLECSKASLMSCLMGSAQLALSPEPFLGQVYFVPYWNNKKGQREAQLIPGYRGYVTLARRSGEVSNLSAQAVYENDFFDIEYGTSPMLKHKPNLKEDRGKFVSAYTVFYYHSTEPSFDHMTISEINRIRDRSRAKDSGPWVTDFEEMAKKTVIRRHVKIVPLSIDDKLAMAAQAENLALAGDGQASLFLPDIEDPIEVSGEKEWTDEEKAVEFYDSMRELGWGQKDKLLVQFMELTAGASNVSVEKAAAMAHDNFEQFISQFEKWVKTQSAEPDKGKPKPNEKPKGKGKGKTEPKGKGKPETEKMSMDDLMQTDEWNELQVLQSQYPDAYKKLSKGIKLDTLKAVSDLIDRMNEETGGAEADGQSGDIPSGDEPPPPSEEDDIRW